MARRLPIALLAALLLLPLAAPETRVPCSDPRGCPDLTVDPAYLTPHLRPQTFAEESCAVEEGLTEPGERVLLRFSTVTPNLGPGALRIGAWWERPEWFEFSPCHRHVHLLGYAEYRLWRPQDFLAWRAHRDAHPEQAADEALAQTGLAPVEGRKQGFCIMDILLAPVGARGPPDAPRHVCTDMGISVGWADFYDFQLDGQWIDVTSVPHGAYVLEVEVNPQRFFAEESYADNAAWVPVVV